MAGEEFPKHAVKITQQFLKKKFIENYDLANYIPVVLMQKVEQTPPAVKKNHLWRTAERLFTDIRLEHFGGETATTSKSSRRANIKARWEEI